MQMLSLRNLVLTAALALAACQQQTVWREAPLPDSLMVGAAPAGLPAERAAFLGRWHGQWENSLDSYLVVLEVSETQAEVFYSWGANRWTPQAGSIRRTARFKDGKLVLQINEWRGTRAEFEMIRPGTLEGRFTDPQGRGGIVWMSCETCS